MKFKCHQKYLSHKEGCKKAGVTEAANRPSEAPSSITNASSPSKESLSTLESAPNTNLLNLVSNKELFVTTERAPNVSLLPDLSLSRESLPTAKSAPYTDVLEDLPSSKESLTYTRSAPNIELLPDLSGSQEFLSILDTPYNDQDNMGSVMETSNPPIEAPNTDTISSKGIHFERECNVVLDDVLEIKAKKKGGEIVQGYQCYPCRMVFISYRGLEVHRRGHPECFNYAFQCDVCTRSFKNDKGLRQHQDRYNCGPASLTIDPLSSQGVSSDCHQSVDCNDRLLAGSDSHYIAYSQHDFETEREESGRKGKY